MNQKRKYLAIIPARGGSKGIIRKNMRNILGKPLIDFTIQAAKDSRYIDHIYLSSEDDEILSHGVLKGIEIIRRPAQFSSDTASADDVVRHFIEQIRTGNGMDDPYIVYLQPTSPRRTGQHIDKALELMEDHSVHTLVSIVEMDKSPYKSFLLDENGKLNSLFEERLSNARRQDLPKVYIPNGAIYVFRVSDYLERNGFPSNGSLPFIMDKQDSIDVDTEEDITYLEHILSGKNGRI